MIGMLRLYRTQKRMRKKWQLKKTLNDINLSVNGLKSLGRVKDNLKIKEK